MKPMILSLTVCALLFLPASVLACDAPVSVCADHVGGSFGLVRAGTPAAIFVDDEANSAVKAVADAFARDLQSVTGQGAPILQRVGGTDRDVVIIGVIGHSRVIDSLVREKKIDVSQIRGKWEAYEQVVIDNPSPGIGRALVIVGSDRRGAVFGTYDISEKMGVSPWNWWADVPVEKRADVYITPGATVDYPRVRYRGLFINDEDPALKGWATRSFGGVNSRMYEKVFELILRLKGNYIWPAMWGKAFSVDDPRSPVIADSMGVVMGTSHHEPMTRAQKEWHLDADGGVTGGAWDYTTNAANLRKFWRGGVERMMSKPGGGGYENVVTVGMRGDGDEPMSEGTATALLETIVHDQRKIIADVTRKPADQTPQVWALYKEVQQYYDHGMRVPDDVTLLFADDNWGQIRRLPVAGQDNLSRKGGFGVYYHFDYVGAPRNYKWINTNQITKVWQQFDLAYARGARNLWIVNVGDIKPMEYPLGFFMKMAWNPEAMTPARLAAYPQDWAAETFGEEHAQDIGAIMTEYERLASARKPELTDQDTFPLGDSAGPELDGGVMGKIVADWRGLSLRMQAVKGQLADDQKDAFFQLVEYPVSAMSNLYEMYYAAAWNKRLASRNDPRANYFADAVEQAFRRDSQLTGQYHTIHGGKWDGMMNQVHMSYVIWNDPTQQSMPSVTRVAADTPADKQKTVPVFSNGRAMPEYPRDAVVVEAANFDRSSVANGLSWRAIPHLGRSKAAMIVLPQGAPASSIGEGARLEYDVEMSLTAPVQVTLVMAPTLDTSNSGGVKIGVSIDDGPVEVLTSALRPTGGAANLPEEKAWYKAVQNNQVTLDAVFDKVAVGKHVVNVWRIDDNVILERVVVMAGAAAPTS